MKKILLFIIFSILTLFTNAQIRTLTTGDTITNKGAKVATQYYVSQHGGTGTVTSIATGNGITGGTISSTGTLGLSGVTGDIGSFSGTDTYSAISAVAIGQILSSAGVSTKPVMTGSPTLTTSLTVPLINGGSSANDDITINGTSSGTKTTSYVNLQTTGGNVGIANTAPAYALDIKGSFEVSNASQSSLHVDQRTGVDSFQVVIGGTSNSSLTGAPFAITNLTAAIAGGHRETRMLCDNYLGNYPIAGGALGAAGNLSGYSSYSLDTLAGGHHGPQFHLLNFSRNYFRAGPSSTFAGKNALEYFDGDMIMYSGIAFGSTYPDFIFRTGYGGTEHNIGTFYASGEFSFGAATPTTGTRMFVKGMGATSATYCAEYQNSSGTDLMKLYNDGVLSLGGAASSGAILDLNSTSKGFVPPRMTTGGMNSVTTPVAGNMVYNSDSANFCFYNGGGWLKFGLPKAGGNNRIVLSTGGSQYGAWSAMSYPSTIASGSIPYATGTNALGSSTALNFDGTHLGINVTTPGNFNVDMACNTSGQNAGFQSTAYRNGGSVTNFFLTRCARGSLASPTISATSDPIFAIDGQAYSSVGTPGFYYAGEISLLADATPLATTAPGRLVFSTSSSSTILVEAMRINSSQNVGIGASSTISARLHLISTTEQLRTGYDASNYFSTTVGSTGGVTYDAVGSGAAFTFNDNLKAATGKTVFVKAGGAGDCRGHGTLVGGTLTVSTTCATANKYDVIIWSIGGTVTNIGNIYISAASAATSFAVTSTNVLDTEDFGWWIVPEN